jgi:acyl-CoA reductase-like NAD-dependent aldehyde dehydrogenase
MAISENIPLEQIVKDAINKRVEEIAEEEYEDARKRIEERKPEAIAGVVLAVERYLSMERIGPALRIEIKAIQ